MTILHYSRTMLLYLHIYHFSQISTPLFRPFFCVHVYYIYIACCIALLNLCLPRSVNKQTSVFLKVIFTVTWLIEFILSAPKQSLWDPTFLFLLTTKKVVLQILCPFKNKWIIRNYNIVITLSLPFNEKGKNIGIPGLKEPHRQSCAVLHS